MERLRMTAAVTAGLTVFATVWSMLGPVGQTLVATAAAVAAIGYLWQKLVLPVHRTVTNAAKAYETLTGVDTKLDQLSGRVDSAVTAMNQRAQGLEDRVSRIERTVDWLRSRVGTRDGDHPDRL